MSTVAKADRNDNKQVYLLPDGYKNDLFKKNLKFFESSYPKLFNALKKHTCDEYKICLNGDGTPNVYNTLSRTLLYESKPYNLMLKEARDDVNRIGLNIHIKASYLNFDSNRGLNRDPIQKSLLKELYDGGSFVDYDFDSKTKQKQRSIGTIKPDYCPLLRIYGIGLGYHLIELIKNKRISFISIYEPNMDLFYVSLFTVPWELVFQTFEPEHRHIRLFVTTPPAEMVEDNKKFFSGLFRYLVTGFSRYIHLSGCPEIEEAIRLEQSIDDTMLLEGSNGWYEDQRAGYYYSARNIFKNRPFFNGKKLQSYFRVFVVGCGPSLDESIDFLRNNKEEALILSCGSALVPLLNHGIIPDYQVVQERDWHDCDYESDYDPEVLKKITLLKLNVISPLLDKFYKETLIFQKYNDPGSTLLGEEYPVTTDVNPTVANAGMSFAAELGAKEIYLFGVDYGAPTGSSKMHASGSWYDKGQRIGNKRKDSIRHERSLNGVFGEKIETTHQLAVSLKVSENRIRLDSNIRWINVGRGAAIQGTKAVKVKNLRRFSRKFQKKSVVAKLRESFDTSYFSDQIIKEFRSHTVSKIGEYFNVIRLFREAKPKIREDVVRILILMNQAVIQRSSKKETTYSPPALLSGSLQEFIQNVYLQILLSNDDQRAIKIFNNSMDALERYFHRVINDIDLLARNVDKVGDVEVKDFY